MHLVHVATVTEKVGERAREREERERGGEREEGEREMVHEGERREDGKKKGGRRANAPARAQTPN